MESRELENKHQLSLNNWTSNFRKIKKIGGGAVYAADAADVAAGGL